MRTALKIAAVVVAVLASGAAALAMLWADFSASERDTVGPVLERHAGLAIGLAFLTAVVLSFGVGWFMGRWSGGARRLAADVRVASTANPQHTWDATGPAELRELSGEVRELAARHAAALAEREADAARARADAEQQRNRLAALMANITQAVVLCRLDGRILLYNEHARDLLGGRGYVGLGRSLFDVAPDGALVGARDTLVALAERGEPVPQARCALDAGERLLRAELSGVRDADGTLDGFLVAAEDVTVDSATSDERSALLRELAQGTRGSVASMRAAAEAMRDYGELGPEERRFLAVIADEGEALTTRLDAALRALGAPDTAHRTLDRLRAMDAVDAIAPTLRRELHCDVRCLSAPEDAWVALDPHRIGQALAALPGLTGPLELSAEAAGTHVRLALGWGGTALDAGALARWEDAEVAPGVPVRRILARHAAEAWSRAVPGGAVLHVLMPAARAPRPAPAPSARAVTYDFDLFGGVERAGALGDRRLRELAFTVFDCETTGLDAHGGDEIVSIAAVRIVNGRVLGHESFDELVDPRTAVSEASVRIHGLTNADLAGRPGIETVLPRFARFAGDTVLVGHDVAFDLQFVERHRAHAGGLLDQPVLDTLLLGAAALPEHADHTLEALAARFGVTVDGRHSALGDARATAAIFLHLVRVLESRGLATLAAAAEAARSTAHARTSQALYSARG